MPKRKAEKEIRYETSQQAEVARLRKALEQIADACCSHKNPCDEWAGVIARAALEGKDD